MVGEAVAVDLARGGVAFKLFMQVLQRAQIVVIGLAGGLEGAAAFEQRHHREQRVGAVFAQLNDAAAALRHQFHQALGGQRFERLARGVRLTCQPTASAFSPDTRARRQNSHPVRTPQP